MKKKVVLGVGLEPVTPSSPVCHSSSQPPHLLWLRRRKYVQYKPHYIVFKNLREQEKKIQKIRTYVVSIKFLFQLQKKYHLQIHFANIFFCYCKVSYEFKKKYIIII